MADLDLTPEQEAEAQRLAALIGQKAQEEVLRMARILVSKPDAQLLGATEFEIRERAHAFYERQGYEHTKTQKSFRKKL